MPDFRAYRQLNRKGLLSLHQWARSIRHPQIFPVFRWYDPLPAIVQSARRVQNLLRQLRVLQPVEFRLDGHNGRVSGKCQSLLSKSILGRRPQP
jgi:hypothetical protein